MLCLVVVTRKRVMGWSWVWGPMPYILEEKNSTFLDSLVNQKNKRPVQHIVSSLLVLTSQCFVSLCYTASCLRYIWGHVEWGKFTNMKIRTNQSFELKKRCALPDLWVSILNVCCCFFCDVLRWVTFDLC